MHVHILSRNRWMVLRKSCEPSSMLNRDHLAVWYIDIWKSSKESPFGEEICYVCLDIACPTGHERAKSRRGRPANMPTKVIACIFSYDILFQVSRECNILNTECFEMQWGVLNQLTPDFSFISRWCGQFMFANSYPRETVNRVHCRGWWMGSIAASGTVRKRKVLLLSLMQSPC
jgi:hypothetical protein